MNNNKLMHAWCVIDDDNKIDMWHMTYKTITLHSEL